MRASSVCPPTKVERGLTLFLAVLVEIGAALGLYFATGHIRSDETRPRATGQGGDDHRGQVLKDVSEPKQRALR